VAEAEAKSAPEPAPEPVAEAAADAQSDTPAAVSEPAAPEPVPAAPESSTAGDATDEAGQAAAAVKIQAVQRGKAGRKSLASPPSTPATGEYTAHLYRRTHRAVCN